MTAYFNELDPYPAQWLRNLSDAGHIAPGYVDNRSIKEVKPDDLSGYDQCHFFAGIGVWSYALRLAGWPDDREVWTGSCPCQPFSAAGKRGGTDDPRHLWPDWFRLIRERRPPVVFGEQVASKDGLAWLDLVYADLEGAGYAVAAVDLPAASVGAPHIRQRLYFVAHAPNVRREGGRYQEESARYEQGRSCEFKGTRSSSRVADTQGKQMGNDGQSRRRAATAGELADAESISRRLSIQQWEPRESSIEFVGRGEASGYWSDLEWLQCRDGKARPTQPGLFPLAHGATARVGRLRAYGNAIVGPLAAEFIRAYMEAQ